MAPHTTISRQPPPKKRADAADATADAMAVALPRKRGGVARISSMRCDASTGDTVPVATSCASRSRRASLSRLTDPGSTRIMMVCSMSPVSSDAKIAVGVAKNSPWMPSRSATSDSASSTLGAAKP